MKYMIGFFFAFFLSGCVVVSETSTPVDRLTIEFDFRSELHSVILWHRYDCRDVRYTQYNRHRRCLSFDRHDSNYLYGRCPIVLDRFGRYRLDCRYLYQ